MTRLNEVLRNDTPREGQLATAQANRNRLQGELEQARKAYAAAKERAESAGEVSDSELDEHGRTLTRLELRTATLKRQLREAEALVTFLADPLTIVAFRKRDAEAQARAAAQVAAVDKAEELMRQSADALLDAGFPPAVRDALFRGAVQRFVQYLGQPGLEPASPGLLRRANEPLSQVFLPARPRPSAA